MTTDSPTGGETLEERLRERPLHVEIHDRLVPALRDVANRMEPEYARRLREETGAPDAEPLFLSSDRAFLREAADEIARYRRVCPEAADEIIRLRAAITTPEVYYGVIAEGVADAYEKQGAELRQARAEVERLTVERDEAVEWLGVVRDELVIAGYPGGDRTVALANIRALIARAARLEEARDAWEAALRSVEEEVYLQYVYCLGAREGARLEQILYTFVIARNNARTAINPEGGEDA